jgi:hypothetical protein
MQGELNHVFIVKRMGAGRMILASLESGELLRTFSLKIFDTENYLVAHAHDYWFLLHAGCPS